MSSTTDCLVMAKPAGPACTLRCGYCYYLRKAALFSPGPWRMSEDMLRSFIIQRLQASPGPSTHFEWHGGEPTLMGLDFFRAVVRLQKENLPPGRTVTNGIQTSGMLMDDEWARFLAQEGFSVGLSIDGPADLHDAFRVTADGGPTQARALDTFRLLRQHRVFCNVLCVLHAKNAAEPDRVYSFFRGLGVSYLQFLPLVAPAPGGGVSAATASAPAIGAFLCRVFDMWMREDVGRIVIQAIDEALRPVYGIPHALCVHRETCGDVAVLEHDGGFYMCDHFVDVDHHLGNIGDRTLADMAADPRLRQFGQDKQATLPRFCRECDVLSFCNGGCPKDRFATTPDGESGLNYLCPAYQQFFRHARPGLASLAAHMKAGRSLRSFAPAGA